MVGRCRGLPRIMANKFKANNPGCDCCVIPACGCEDLPDQFELTISGVVIGTCALGPCTNVNRSWIMDLVDSTDPICVWSLGFADPPTDLPYAHGGGTCVCTGHMEGSAVSISTSGGNTYLDVLIEGACIAAGADNPFWGPINLGASDVDCFVTGLDLTPYFDAGSVSGGCDWTGHTATLTAL